MSWRLFRKPAPLTGAPSIRRAKTYSAASGFVYEYYYLGHRGLEYVFEFSAAARRSARIAVEVLPDALADWERRRRPLTETERYGIAKMALFQAFDERVRPDLLRGKVLVRPADLAPLLQALGIE